MNLPNFQEFSLHNRVHGPVRALKWYIELSKPLKRWGGGSEKAFIISMEPYFKATESTVSGWVKEAISGAYSHLTGEQRQQIGIRAMISEGFRPPGQVWPVCHSKRLWMVRCGVVHKPLLSST